MARFRVPLKIGKKVIDETRKKYAADTRPGSYIFEDDLGALCQIPERYLPAGMAYTDWMLAVGRVFDMAVKVAIDARWFEKGFGLVRIPAFAHPGSSPGHGGLLSVFSHARSGVFNQ